MFTVTINGRSFVSDRDCTLLEFLREELGLTGTKDGCAEGACGACTVLVDGKKTKSCIPRLSKLEGKSVVTIEGLSEREKEVYAYCFAQVGAVQCGFCIPGMVMSAKSLLDVNLDPDVSDVREAIKGNICRCTGYKKIEKAILMSAEFLRERKPVPAQDDSGGVNMVFHRIDAAEKALGLGKYTDDISLPGMLHLRALRPPCPRAKLLSLGLERARAHPDCAGIITAEDVPNNKSGHIVQDWDTLIGVGQITRYVGDAVALVASEKKESLGEIISLIDAKWEELEPVKSPFEALREGAPLIHEGGNVLSMERLKRGDASEAIRTSAFKVTKKYKLPFGEHAFLEPECAVAAPEGDGVRVYTGGQSVYDEQREISHILGLDPGKVRCTSMLVGGAFGGKEDMSVQHHAALAAWLLKRPVKMKLSRQESIERHPKRHAMEMEFTTACDENGCLTGMKASIISDTGAYASLGGPVLQRACTHAAGPYNYHNIDITGMAVYTNNVPAGAFRGFGVTQSTFAAENNLNVLAEMVGISPWEIRYRNAIRPGQELPNGQIADESAALAECLEAVKEDFEKEKCAGIACAFKNSGLGVGIPDTGRCLISVEEGAAHIRSSAACVGQGAATVWLQMLCETTGLRPSQIVVEKPDTARTPDSGTSTASRQTAITGEAVRRAAESLLNDLKACGSLEALEGREYFGEFTPETDPMGSDKPNPVSHLSYSYSAQVAALDDDGRVKKITAAVDLGVPININSAVGQIEGGIVMGLGMALTEDLKITDCRPKARFGTLGLLRAPQVPDIEVRLVRKEKPLDHSYGAKGVGELCLIPTAPAVSGAYYKRDGKFRLTLPLEYTYYSSKGGK